MTIVEKFKRQVRIIISKIAAIRFGNPGSRLKLIGVTGTSGKSTTSMMIYHTLQECGYKVGVISTIGAKAGKKVLDTGLHVTTPDPYNMQEYLKFMLDMGCEYVVIESSSHALAQGRLGDLKFEHSVFTNITRDHLDWHKTWENYASSKAELAIKTKKKGKIIVNRDNKEGYDFLKNYLGKKKADASRIVTYSLKEVSGIAEESNGIYFQIGLIYFYIPIIGRYNIENALSVITLCNIMGLSYEEIANALKSFEGIEGRMQIMKAEPFQIIVNFAHNTDSLIRSLKSVRSFMNKSGKLIVVFGSAGLRDVEKRYTMGEAAAEFADIIVITSEDPRTEKLYDINTQIIEGTSRKLAKLVRRIANSSDYKSFIKENATLTSDEIDVGSVFVFDEDKVNSRFDAIDFAIRIAKAGDVVITEGKGHEKSLCFGEIEYPFTDQEAVEKAINNL